MKGVAFCPAHVTGFFKAELDEKNNLEQTGSQGAGFSIQKGVKTTVLVRKKTAYDDSNFHLNILGYGRYLKPMQNFVPEALYSHLRQ